MAISNRWWMVVIPAALAACGGDGVREDHQVDTTATAVPAGTEGTAGMRGTETGTPGATPSGPQIAVALAPTAESGVSGEATLSEPTAGQTRVMIHLTGLQPNSSHAGHIHSGTCASPGPAVAPLPEATADAGGMAMVNGTASRALSEVANGSHLIAYHQNAGEDHGPTIVCGEIPAGTV